MPPADSRMLTPEISFEMAKSSTVTCRAQPPFWMRLGALLNEAQSIGKPPTSVAGGVCAEGNCLPSSGFCGPGSVRLPGLLALTAPCGGSSGLPKVAACALEPTMAAPAADMASKSRRENIGSLLKSSKARCGEGLRMPTLVRGCRHSFREQP